MLGNSSQSVSLSQISEEQVQTDIDYTNRLEQSVKNLQDLAIAISRDGNQNPEVRNKWINDNRKIFNIPEGVPLSKLKEFQRQGDKSEMSVEKNTDDYLDSRNTYGQEHADPITLRNSLTLDPSSPDKIQNAPIS